jgi:CxxC motif-containing protein (DUF1111 family)
MLLGIPDPRALALLTILLLAGCEANRPALSTAPSMAAAHEEVLPAELASDPGTMDLVATSTLGEPLAGLHSEELERFAEGREEFIEEEDIEDGLGPVFNEASCVACHNAPVGGTNGRLETRFGKFVAGKFDAMPKWGGSLMQDHGIGAILTEHGAYNYVAEVMPPSSNVKAGRVTTPLFGLGLVDAVPDASLLALAAQQARFTPSTAGVAHMVTDANGATRVGRFGWKAQVASLHTFSGDAYLNEMGFTSPEFPNENPPQGDMAALAYNPVPEMNDDGEGVQKFADFMTLLGPPPRGARTVTTDAGSQVFRNIGCANCHTSTLTTGNSPITAISRKSFQPFSDFLLHDMGSLGDGIEQGKASGRHMRTAPLWGLTSRPSYLHDGRAKTPEAAIMAHAGQGSAARDRFARLDSRDRYTLLAFLKSL